MINLPALQQKFSLPANDPPYDRTPPFLIANESRTEGPTEKETDHNKGELILVSKPSGNGFKMVPREKKSI
jgi:hypothetical protein